MQDSHKNYLACGDTVVFYNKNTDSMEKGQIVYIHDNNTCDIKYYLTRSSEAYDYKGERSIEICSVPKTHIILLDSFTGTPMIR